MSWWGKIVGGTFGFMLGGPLGALLGVALGHNLDRGLSGVRDSHFGAGPDRERIQTAFFTAVFAVMGHVAKADGRVSEDEIEMARGVMAQMALDENQKKAAINLFNQGKHADFDLDAVVTQFRAECHRRTTLMQMFFEILMHAAYADGSLHPQEEKILRRVSQHLGFSASHFSQIEAMVRAQRFFTGGSGNAAQHAPADLLTDAYTLLGVSSAASDAEVKKAYRRAMNQHHPDKLIAKGLPEEMIALATEKTQEIKSAYELIQRSRS